MAIASSRGLEPPSSSSRQVSISRRNTPLASSKRPAESQEGQRKRQRAQQPLSRLRGHSNTPSSHAPPTTSQLDAEIRAEEAEDEFLDHVVMAIDIRDRDTVGCAYYVAQQQSLICMEDIVGGGTEVLDVLKLDIQPTILLVSPRIDLEDRQDGPVQSARHASMLDSGMYALLLGQLHLLTLIFQMKTPFHTTSSSDPHQNLATMAPSTSLQACNLSMVPMPTSSSWSLVKLPASTLLRTSTILVRRTAQGDCYGCRQVSIWRAESVLGVLEL
jgi:hypothetical protein